MQTDIRPALMAQQTISLFVALVTLQIISTTAAPLDLQSSTAQDVVWMIPTPVASMEPTVTEIVVAFKPLSADGGAAAQTPPSMVTRWDAAIVNAGPTETSSSAAIATTGSWTLPEMFTDLSLFQIEKLAYGSNNIKVVTGIPASASASTAPPAATSVGTSSGTSISLPRTWTNTSSAYRLFYPAGSINPANRPQGGAEFYATPGNLQFETANNVTLEYSIFFPINFEWVQGGKLPGIYGGHQGCSGGNSAKSCFSTRLMWRRGGAGELYLYAPKDKQTPELCNAPPQSVCDAAYGLSVGRGSFHFAPGRWTHVSQTVRLNTPGEQNGGFELFVNGQRIMRRDDVFYRDAPQDDGGDEGGNGGNEEPEGGETHGGILLRDSESQDTMNVEYDIDDFWPLLPSDSQIEEIFELPATTPFSSSQVTSQTKDGDAVGFSGLFFSTFFGGHGQEWASPKDQYTWFKDFGMSVNA